MGSCRCWQVAQLHHTKLGEVPVTCFIPTLVLCHKTRGEVESQLGYLFEENGKSPPGSRALECCVSLGLIRVKIQRKSILFVCIYIL